MTRIRYWSWLHHDGTCLVQMDEEADNLIEELEEMGGYSDTPDDGATAHAEDTSPIDSLGQVHCLSLSFVLSGCASCSSVLEAGC